MQTEKSDSSELKKIKTELQTLEERLTRVEAILRSLKGQKVPSSKSKTSDFKRDLSVKTEGSIEFRVGEYGMAWLGNIVLLFGISFLVKYFQNSGHLISSALTGFISVAGIYIGAHFTRTSYLHLSKLFTYTGHLLLFYMVVQLHFFQAEPLISNKLIGLSIPIITLGILFYIAYHRKSQLMASLILLMMLTFAIISNSTHLLTGIPTLVALLAIIVYYRFGWIKLAFIFIPLIYFSYLNWLINNPLISNKLEFIESPGMEYLYIAASAIIFSLLALIPQKDHVSKDMIVTSVILNGLSFTIILILTTFTYLSQNYVPIFGLIATFCLGYSILLRSRSTLNITAAMYALYGFLAMSVAFYGILLLPKAYTMLSVQSLLVVSMALWFQSRFIVVMNAILFLFLLVFYLMHPTSDNTTDFSFMLVAFITARVINWKKERLNIKTELIRNLYLILGWGMTLIAFHHAISTSYITISWISIAIVFFMMSLLLRNFKYRWLAIATLIAAAIKLILIDLSNINLGLRVLAFLILAIISIAISILYTKYYSRKKKENA